ncbi:MAG TPA: hypothetical protein PLY84_04240 [Bacilli bacterium]|nr:hypothetical protein [Bacilli bacterium]
MKQSLLRTSLVVALILALIGLTASSFAYWDRLTTEEKDNTVIIGEGAELKVTKKVTVTDALIPKTAVLGVGEVYEVVLEYEVKLSKEAQEDLVLHVEKSNVLIGGDDTYSYLVNIEITGDFFVNASGTKITVTVTLTEPTALEIYEAIFGKTITFDLTFQGHAQV